MVIDPSALPQEGDGILRRRPPVVRPAGQGRQLPGRRLPGLRRRRRATPRWTGGSTCPRTGPHDKARREKCHVPPEVKFQEKWRIALDLLDRSLPGSAPRLGRRRRRVRPGRRVPRRAASRAGALRAGRAVQHHGPRPGAAAPAAASRPAWAASARCRSRRVDDWAKSQPESRWERLTVRDGGEGAAGGRCDDGAGPGQAGAADRAGGAAGGDADRRRVADRLRAEQRRPRGPAGRGGPVPSVSGTGSRRCSRPARARRGWITTRCAVGWVGITT